MDDDERRQFRADFDAAVNMTPRALEQWLETDESSEVGWRKEDGGESVGHESGRRSVGIKRHKRDELTDDDYEHMREVVGYVHRHLEQGGPADDKEHSRWRTR